MTNQTITEIRNAVDNMIKQLLRSENISKENFDLNEKIANIYEL